MSNEKKTTVIQSLVFGQMAEAQVIPAGAAANTITASGLPLVRTVTTSMTSGVVNIRYVPRPAQAGSGTDTNS